MNDKTAEADTEIEAPRRHDAAKSLSAQRHGAVESKRRNDSPADVPIDGWGEPFQVQCAPGWLAFFVSEHDAGRLGWRPWTVATWGDPRIVDYKGAAPGEKGKAIVYRELTCYLMSKENWAATQRRDPRRVRHAQIRTSLFEAAAESGAVDAVNPNIRIPNPTHGHVTPYSAPLR